MLRIRLRRVGAKKQPSYRIVIAEKSAPRDGKFVEVIGFYNPRTNPETVKIDEERALHWLSVGAQPSDSVARIFTTHGTMARFERLRAGESLSVLVAESEESAPGEAPAEVEPEPEPEPEPEVETEADVSEGAEAEVAEASEAEESGSDEAEEPDGSEA
jgi:small subunit ribosomal protein S16